MKVLCKRTYFLENSNIYGEFNKAYGEKYVAYCKNKYYEYEEADGYPKTLGIKYYIMSEDGSSHPLTDKDFHRYFYDIEQIRDIKLNEIFK